MWYRIKAWLTDPDRNLWIMPTIGVIFALVFSLTAAMGNRYLAEDAVPSIAAETLSSLLDIIASSMLTVTTFSLSIMVTALGSTSDNATPRARVFVVADDSTRLTIASFVSAFIYAIIARVALGMQYYGTQGRFILFVSTVLVLLYLIFILIRWMQRLSQLGSVGNIMEKIESATKTSLAQYLDQPYLGATHASPNDFADDILPKRLVSIKKTGDLSQFDMQGLQEIAIEYDCHIHLLQRPGDFVNNGMPMFALYREQAFDDEHINAIEDKLMSSVIIDSSRSYAQDPRLGFSVLAETGQRALSAAVNDPATAIDVIKVVTRLLLDTKPEASDKQDIYDRLSIVPLPINDFIEPVFLPISRDGINNVDVGIHLLSSLGMIATHSQELNLQSLARYHAQHIYERYQHALDHQSDLLRIQRSYQRYFTQ